MVLGANEIAELEWFYLFLDRRNPVADEYFPYIYEDDEERKLYIFSSKSEADTAANEMKLIMGVEGEDLIPVAKVGRKELVAITLEYCLHGGEKVIVNQASDNIEEESTDLLNLLYERLGYGKVLTEDNKNFPKLIRKLLMEEVSFFTLPKAATTGEQIMDNQFLTIHDGEAALFFADEELAQAYYEEHDLPSVWSVESNFRQFVQLLLYAYDQGMKSLLICTQEEKLKMELDQAFWLIQKISRNETYLLLKEDHTV